MGDEIGYRSASSPHLSNDASLLLLVGYWGRCTCLHYPMRKVPCIQIRAFGKEFWQAWACFPQSCILRHQQLKQSFFPYQVHHYPGSVKFRGVSQEGMTKRSAERNVFICYSDVKKLLFFVFVKAESRFCRRVGTLALIFNVSSSLSDPTSRCKKDSKGKY